MSRLGQHDSPSTDTLAGKGGEIELSVEEEEDEEEDTHSCGKCHQIFISLEDYLRHKMKAHKVKVKYHKAGGRMIVPQFVQTVKKNIKKEPHNEEDEENSKKVQVQHKRAKLFHTEANIIERTSYKCTSCDKTFRREAALKRHLEFDHRKAVDSDEDDLVIDDIKTEGIDDESEDYRQPNEKSPRAKTIVMEKPPPQISSPQKADDGERPYECSECARRFKEIPVLRAHMLTHSDRRDFPCSFHNCRYSFKTKGSLKRHMRRHTGERPYKCLMCGRCFGESGALTRHMKARTSCTSKTDADLPRYGKRLQFVDFNKSGEPAVVLLPGNNTQLLQQPGEESSFIEGTTGEEGEIQVQGETQEIILEDVEKGEAAREGWPEGTVVIISEPQTTVQNQCKACLEGFENENDLKTHLKSHLADLPFRCGLCTFATGKRDSLNQHMQIEHQTSLKSLPEGHSYEPSVSVTLEGPVISAAEEETQSHVEQVILTDGVTGEVIEISHQNTGEVVEISEEALQGNETISADGMNNIEADIEEHQPELIEETVVIQLEPSEYTIDEVALLTEKEELGVKGPEEKEQVQSQEEEHREDQEQEQEQEQVQVDLEKQSRDAAVALQQLIELRDTSDTQPVAQPGNHGFKNVHKCLICHRTFRGASYLRLHLRTHTGERPHKCTQCGKTFSTKDTLSKHMSSHNEERTYKCGECGKMFKRISHVREHLKIHTNDRPFNCSVCFKSFKTSNACKVHMRTHSDLLPWECHYCHRHFREKGSLERHMRTHTGEKPFRCLHCNKSFAEHGTLNRHMKAKVPCTKQMHDEREALKQTMGDEESKVMETEGMEAHEVSEEDASSLLAEFSSVVTDTQQYIIQTDQTQHETEVATEYVLVNAGEETEGIHNIEIVTEEQADGAGVPIEGAEYVLLNSGDENITVAMVDSETGQVVPVSGQPIMVNTLQGDNTIQTVTMVAPSSNQIEAIAMAPDSDAVQQAMLVANVLDEQPAKES